jgi:hypothetical protein
MGNKIYNKVTSFEKLEKWKIKVFTLILCGLIFLFYFQIIPECLENIVYFVTSGIFLFFLISVDLWKKLK